MKKVWKFILTPEHPCRIEMPMRAQVLAVGCQGEAVVLWALVDDREPREARRFYVYGTGQQIERVPPLTHVGTAQMFVGGVELVWHVFEAVR